MPRSLRRRSAHRDRHYGGPPGLDIDAGRGHPTEFDSSRWSHTASRERRSGSQPIETDTMEARPGSTSMPVGDIRPSSIHLDGAIQRLVSVAQGRVQVLRRLWRVRKLV
ncbi:hypothetical protein PHYPSEUDO_013934 [Phytophthora pseudosyringae]|uniref:Uncharacterized protein n=1 Tax=Phytophthora pseudosyringae TaxID=221518 RepID=A0A8T1V5F3_9STRA|nr:hypothetical protein PHYPSEUDO_013934 [Phytophthora pseudosyringae]